MGNSLKTLSRIQKFAIDEQRKILNAFLEREDKILQDLQILNTTFEQEKDFARQNPHLGDFGVYAKVYTEKRNNLEASLFEVRKKIAEARDVITEMFKEQKTFDIVDRNRAERSQKEIEAQTQKMLDEIGTNNYIKKQDEHKQGES